MFRLYLNATNPGGYFATFEAGPSGTSAKVSITGFGVFERVP
jgi:hypothetical protein